MNWIKRITAVVALLLVPVAIMATPAAATSWTSPYNTAETYYMPGPPPGPYLSACAVSSLNGSSGSYAISWIQGQYNSASSCYFEQTQVIYYNGGTYVGSWSLTYYNGFAQSSSPGPYSDIGGNFNACNTSIYCQDWSTSWL